MRQFDLFWIPFFSLVLGILLVGEWHQNLLLGYFIAVISFLLFALSIWRFSCSDKIRWLFVGGLFLGVGVCLGELHIGHTIYDVAFLEPGQVVLEGTLSEVEMIQTQEKFSMQGKLLVSALIDEKGEKEKKIGIVSFRLAEANKEACTSWYEGVGVRVKGYLQEKEQYRNPGPWLTWQEKSGRGVFRHLSIQGAESFRWIPQQDQLMVGWATQIRGRFLETMEKVMPEKDVKLLKGILFGGRVGLSPEIQNQFAATGLTHLLSVSGTHLAVIFGGILWLGFSFHISKPHAAILGIIVLALYSLLSGFPAPVVRSFWMAFGVALGMISERDANGQRIFALTLIGMLLWEPRWIYDVSFQLSASATAGLIVATPYLEKRKSWKTFWQGPLILTLGTQLFSLPFLAAYFQSVSLLAFLGNLLLLPLFEGALILGMLGCFSSFLLLPLAEFFWIGSSLILGAAMEGVRLFDRFPWALLWLPAVHFWEGMVYYIGLGLFFFAFHAKEKKKQLMTGFISALMLFFLWIKLEGNAASGLLEIHFLDVGQGDAAFIRTPQGKGILIDAGGIPGRESRLDIGALVVSPYLWRIGVRELDLVVLSHEDEDHLGGFSGVAARFPIKEVWGTSLAAASLSGSNLPIEIYPPGYEQIIDGVKFSVLSQPLSSKKGWSQIIEVTYGEHAFLFAGDMDGAEEAQFLQNQEKRTLTGIKIGHHGSMKGTGRDLLKLFSPEIAVISVGESNRYGHPALGTLARLKEFNSKIHRTDIDGRILLLSDGRNYRVESMKSEAK